MRICEYCGSSKKTVRLKQYDKVYCGRHYKQMLRHGRCILTPNDPLRITKIGNYCFLHIRDKHGEEVAQVKFDCWEREWVSSLKWSLSSGGYPRNIKHRKYLHQFVMLPKKGKEIDHINGDPLDNRRYNLRYVTRHQNMWNLSLSKRNKSGCRGLYWDKVNKAWQVKICYYRKQIHLGRFKVKTEAIAARKAAEAKYYGKYTRV